MTQPDDALFGAETVTDRYGGHSATWHLPDQDDLRVRGPGLASPATGPESAKAPGYFWEEAERAVLEMLDELGQVSVDDVRLRRPDLNPSASSAAWGGLFRRLANRGELSLVGYRHSRSAAAHGRVVGVWERPEASSEVGGRR